MVKQAKDRREVEISLRDRGRSGGVEDAEAEAAQRCDVNRPDV